MKAIVIAPAAPLQQALSQQFRARQRPSRIIAPEAVSRLTPADLENAVVVEADTLVSLQSHQHPALSTASRHHLLECCGEAGAPLIQLSDGRVFDGHDEHIAHPENEKPYPGSSAGTQLSTLETQLARRIDKHLILRTGPLFAEIGDNLLTRLFAGICRGDTLQLSRAHKCCPTHVTDLTRIVSGLIDQISCDAQCWGVYHYNSSVASTAFEFAEVVYAHASQQLDLVGTAPVLQPVDHGQTLQPSVPVLSCEKILQHFGIKQFTWRSYLPEAVKVLCESEQP